MNTTNATITNTKPKPFVKWAGGKRSIAAQIQQMLPPDFDSLHYCEPFLGGGAMLFHLMPQTATVGDINAELINAYSQIKFQPWILVDLLLGYKNEKPYYYRIRQQDRTGELEKMTPAQRAARFIYLNKTCFNGLCRYNKAGQFNVPFGDYKAPNIADQDNIIAVSEFLNSSKIDIVAGSYESISANINEHSFFYFDPPYHPVSKTANFTAYSGNAWGEAEQAKLKSFCDKIAAAGARFIVSQSKCTFIEQLYSGYNQRTIQVGRPINSNGSSRGCVEELLIKNY